MPGVPYPIEMVNGMPAVAAPQEIDISNADQLLAVLMEAAARGHGRFVVVNKDDWLHSHRVEGPAGAARPP